MDNLSSTHQTASLHKKKGRGALALVDLYVYPLIFQFAYVAVEYLHDFGELCNVPQVS